MKRFAVVVALSLLGCVLSGMIAGWSIKLCCVGAIAGLVWSLPYAMTLKGDKKMSIETI